MRRVFLLFLRAGYTNAVHIRVHQEMLGQFTLLCPTCWWTGLRWISMHSCNVPDEVAKMQLTVNESIEIIEILSEGFDVTFHTLLLRIGVAAWHLKWVPAVKHV